MKRELYYEIKDIARLRAAERLIESCESRAYKDKRSEAAKIISDVCWDLERSMHIDHGLEK